VTLLAQDHQEETVDWRVRLADRARAAARALDGGVWEWNLLTRAFTWDRRTYDLLGLTDADEALDLSVLFRCVHPHDRARLAEALQRASGGVEDLDCRFRVSLANARPRHLQIQAELIESARGLPGRLVGTLRDVTSAQKLSEALVEERERLQVTLGSIGEAVVTTDLDGAVTFLNDAAAAMVGWTLEEAEGRPLGEVLNVGPGLSDAAILDAAARVVTDPSSGRLRQEARLTTRDGRAFDIESTAAPMRTPLGEGIGAVLVLRDVTEAQELQRRLAHAATHDALTGLANRSLFQDRLAEAVADTTGEHALCFIDVDRFKIINDSAGHLAGDRFLAALVDVLQPFVREGDTLARLGGDEFGLVLRNRSTAEAEQHAGDMARAAKDFRFGWNGRVYSAGVSVGVARILPDVEAAELLSQADAACYAAKNAGRGRVVVFQPDGDAARRRQEIVVAADLRQVIEENRLVLYGQEIVPARPEPGQKRHYEVLVRMFDRDYQLVGAAGFIPAAERFAIMDEVDDWILREAIQRFGHRIAQLGDLEISLNLSANSIDNPALVQFVTGLLEESPLPASALTFEITESAALSHIGAASRVMAGLKDLGCRIALDDFGMGSSSLSYLKYFPADVVKLDGSFITNMLTSEVDYAIVRSINDLAHRIGAKTVAEFVEDEATLQAVTEIGVDYVQGYIHGGPKPLEQIVKALSQAG